VVVAPLIHFQISLSFVSLPVLRSRSSDLPALRQACGCGGQPLTQAFSHGAYHAEVVRRELLDQRA